MSVSKQADTHDDSSGFEGRFAQSGHALARANKPARVETANYIASVRPLRCREYFQRLPSDGTPGPGSSYCSRRRLRPPPALSETSQPLSVASGTGVVPLCGQASEITLRSRRASERRTAGPYVLEVHVTRDSDAVLGQTAHTSQLGSGASIDSICQVLGISRAEFLQRWKRTAEARVPIVSGVRSAAVSRSIEICRNRQGVPHIFAESNKDLFFGFGYAVGQDRLFQLDWLRRKGAGRLSEIPALRVCLKTSWHERWDCIGSPRPNGHGFRARRRAS